MASKSARNRACSVCRKSTVSGRHWIMCSMLSRTPLEFRNMLLLMCGGQAANRSKNAASSLFMAQALLLQWPYQVKTRPLRSPVKRLFVSANFQRPKRQLAETSSLLGIKYRVPMVAAENSATPIGTFRFLPWPRICFRFLPTTSTH